MTEWQECLRRCVAVEMPILSFMAQSRLALLWASAEYGEMDATPSSAA
jgi:hypothetical protein